MSLTDNLVAYYKLDNVNDELSTYTLTNNNTVAFNVGKIGNAADGGAGNTSKYLNNSSLGNTLGSNRASVWSWSGWIYWYDTDVASPNIGGVMKNGAMQINLTVSSSSTRINFYNGSATGEQIWSTTINTGTWYHVVFIKNGTTWKSYLNGSDLGTPTGTVPADGSPGRPSNFTLLRNSYDNGDYLQGLIDEVGVWSRALSSTEITSLYNSGNGLTYPFIIAPSITGITSITGLSTATF